MANGLGHPHIPVVDLPNHTLTPGWRSWSVRPVSACPVTRAASATSRTPRRWPSITVTVPRGSPTSTRSMISSPSRSAARTDPQPVARAVRGQVGRADQGRAREPAPRPRVLRRLALHAAQRQEAHDWVAVYRRYVGTAPSGGSPGPLSGGFYASSYPSASTIDCATNRNGGTSRPTTSSTSLRPRKRRPASRATTCIGPADRCGSGARAGTAAARLDTPRKSLHGPAMQSLEVRYVPRLWGRSCDTQSRPGDPVTHDASHRASAARRDAPTPQERAECRRHPTSARSDTRTCAPRSERDHVRLHQHGRSVL